MKKIVVANWKMNPETLEEAVVLFNKIKRAAVKLRKVQTIICPPAVFIERLSRKAAGAKLAIGAQDCFWLASGPYTGEISPVQLKSLGVDWVILGHSSRRALGETDLIINKKVRAALKAGLRVILCLGERERDGGGSYLRFIQTQLQKDLSGVDRELLAKLTLAYEPVWAISSTVGSRPDSPEDYHQMSIYLRKLISDRFGPEAGRKAKVIYGGTVDQKNAREFLVEGRAEGFLVGRASLNPPAFKEILEIAESVH